MITASHETRPLDQNLRTRWVDQPNEKYLLPQQGPGPELESLSAAKLRYADVSEHIIQQDASLNRLLSLVSVGYGALLVFEGATGACYDGVVYHEVWDDDAPTPVNFMAYWREANSNPALQSFLALLREHYPDLSGERGPV